MRSLVRLLLLPLFLGSTTAAARAQVLTYAGVPWGTPADSVRARMEALGWRHRATVPTGDQVYFGADGTELDVWMYGGRVFRFIAIQRGDGLEARFRARADSLQAALGAPVDQRPALRAWDAARSAASVAIIEEAATGERTLQMQFRGPAYLEAMEAREGSDFARLPVGFAAVIASPTARVAVDSAGLQRLDGGRVRARFRIDFADPQHEGAGQYDAVEYRIEPDCVGARVRLQSRTTYLRGARQNSDALETAPWTQPQGESQPASGLDAVCRVLGQPLPPRPRSFRPLPAGWVMISEDIYSRRVMDTNTIATKGAGVYAATMWLERGRVEAITAGRADATRLAVEVDCNTNRLRITGMAWSLAGQDVRPLPLVPQLAAWQPAPPDSPVPLVVCRIVRERGL